MPQTFRGARAALQRTGAEKSPPDYLQDSRKDETLLSPTSRRFDAIIRRFGVSAARLEPPRGPEMPKRQQDGTFSPTISPPIEVRTSYDFPNHGIETPNTVRPPPRPPRSASRGTRGRTMSMPRSESSAGGSWSDHAHTAPLPSTATLEPAFVLVDDAKYKRDRRISGIINGLGLDFSSDTEGSASEHFEDAKERFSEDLVYVDRTGGLQPTERALALGRDEQLWPRPSKDTITSTVSARDLARGQVHPRPRSKTLPTDVPATLDDARSDRADGSVSSATADVLSSYTESPEPADIDLQPDSFETVIDDSSRRARRTSDAVVRSWLPTLEYAHPSVADQKKSRRKTRFWEHDAKDSRIEISEAQWNNRVEGTQHPGRPSTARHRDDRRQESRLAAQRNSRCRSHTDAVLRYSHSAPALKLKPAIKSAAISPALGSAPSTPAPWRSTLATGEYDLLHSVYGTQELKRQEVIAELCMTELAFVNGLRGVVRVFLAPLRQPSGSWLRGVPQPIGRLFDWLEDIVWLHGEISAALETRRISSHPIVNRIADVFLGFVQRLEVHQPYLVRFDGISALLDDLIKDEDSDFGEFVRMQQLLPECGKMSLPSFLLKPIQRLTKYTLFFKQLHELTPASHPDHLATLSLMHSTEAIIGVMQEVKARENEYASLKALASRIVDVPPGFVLARRERRLIAHGQLRRIVSGSGLKSPPVSPILPVRGASLTSRLFPIASPVQPAVDGDKRNSMISDISHFSDISGASSALSSVAGLTSPKLRVFSRQRAQPLQIFVFNDLVLFTTWQMQSRASRHGPSVSGCYQLVPDIGLGRVLGVSDLSSKDTDHLIELSILPITSDHDTLVDLTQTCVQPLTVRFSLPHAPSSASVASQIADRQRWVSAFEQALKTTLGALSSLPTPPLTADRRSVESVLAAGLPMPKSPSEQQLDARDSKRSSMQGEREERGYWAGRLKAVRREFAMDQAAVVQPGAPSLPPLPILKQGKKSRERMRG